MEDNRVEILSEPACEGFLGCGPYTMIPMPRPHHTEISMYSFSVSIQQFEQ